MTEEVQTQQVKIGFEQALIIFDPNWRTNLSEEDVNKFRHFYNQGVQHMNFLIQLQNAQMAQNFQAVLNTVVVTGNEEKIAAAQAAEAAARAAEQAESEAPVKAAKPAKKAVPAAPKKAAKVVKPAAKKGKK